MAIVLLALASLFALIVASRPILPNSNPSDFVSASTPPKALQNPFQILPGRDDLKFDAARFHPQNSKQPIENASELNPDSIATISSLEIFPGAHPSLETCSDECAIRQDAFDANELDDFLDDHVFDGPNSLEPVVDEQQEASINQSSILTLTVLAFSCVAAFLALTCIALTLYAVRSFRLQVIASKTAWELFQRVWKHPKSQADASEGAENHIPGGGHLLQKGVGQHCYNIGARSAGRHGVHTEDTPMYFDAMSDTGSVLDDGDEKYQDVLDVTPLLSIHDLPLIESDPHRYHDHLPSLSTATYLLDQPTSDRRTSLMHTVPSPIYRPAWPVRAFDTPTLGLISRGDGSIDLPLQPFIHPRRRAYRSVVPEFDVALVMQLWPSVGIGADSAWVVRFIMVIFGWFTVALTGNTR